MKGAGMALHFKSAHPGEKYVGKKRGGVKLQQPAAIASGANPLCSITVGDFVHGFAFNNLTELDAGIAEFKGKVEAARKLIPLAFIGASVAASLQGASVSERRLSRVKRDAVYGNAAAAKSSAGIACPKCGKQFKCEGKPFRRHTESCGVTASAATDTGFIAIINLKPADMAAVKDEVDPSHISFIMSEPDASRILGASDVILYRFEKTEWFTVANNTLKKNKIHVAHDLDGVIAIAKKLTR